MKEKRGENFIWELASVIYLMEQLRRRNLFLRKLGQGILRVKVKKD
jgi:hypothetical protein